MLKTLGVREIFLSAVICLAASAVQAQRLEQVPKPTPTPDLPAPRETAPQDSREAPTLPPEPEPEKRAPVPALPIATPDQPAEPSRQPVLPEPDEQVQPARPPGFFKMMFLDVRYVMLRPFHWDGSQWLLFAGYTAAVAGSSAGDKALSDKARASGRTLGVVGDTLEGLGDGRSFVLLGGFYAAGLIGRDAKAKAVCIDGLYSSLIAAGLITPVLSTVVGRARPTAEEGAYRFRPFHGRSFPSGHTTQVFAVVSVIATHYDQLWVKAAAYGAGLVGSWARLRRGKHFPSDILAAGIIGTAVGRSVVHYNDRLRSGEIPSDGREKPGARLMVLPLLDGDHLGLGGTLRF